jgi:hypothetical protein
MKRSFWILTLVGTLAFGSMIGCNNTNQKGPVIASSAQHITYAAKYPDTLGKASDGLGEQDAEIKKLTDEFGKYADELKDPPWDKVGEVYEKADETGKSSAYVERSRQLNGAKQFFEDNKEEIEKKVAGSAQYAAKQKGCKSDVGGAAIHGMKEGIKEQLLKKEREVSEAHLMLERYQTTFGKENLSHLEKHADNISRASYMVNIVMVEKQMKLRDMIKDSEQVKSTLNRFIKEEEEFQKRDDIKDADKKASQGRIEIAQDSLKKIDESVKKAQEQDKVAEKMVKDAQDAYNKAFQELMKGIKEKAKNSPKKS